MSKNAITVENVRLSYVNVHQPKPPYNNPQGEPKFSVTVLVPKTNAAAKALMDQAIARAIEAGVSTKWNGVRPPQPAVCVHDGDGPRPSDGSEFGAECKGMWVFTASCRVDRPPFVVDGNVQPIIDPTQIYSGVWANVSVTFFPYSNAGKKGIGCGLNGLQKLRDDEPLGSTVTAEDAFKPVAFQQNPAVNAGPAYGVPVAPQQQYAPAVTGYGQPVPGVQQYAPAADPWGLGG